MNRINEKGKLQTRRSEVDFLNRATEIALEVYKEQGFTDLEKESIKLESYRKTLANHKAVMMISGTSTLVELTYDGDIDKIYVGFYKKVGKGQFNFKK